MNTIRRLVDISTTDPDDARRRKLLNILLSALVGLMVVGFIAMPLAAITGLGPPLPKLFPFTLPAMLIGAALIYSINRFWSGQVAGWIFLFLLTASVFTNSPETVISSHVILTFAIPIVIASFLLRPYASFIMAGLISLVLAFIGVLAPRVGINVAPMLTLFLIAMVSWIAARSLENALANLRTLNRELDQRVIERTQELSEALGREQAEASKSQAILEGIADGVIVFDNSGQAAIANPAMVMLLGQPIEEIIGRDINTLMGENVEDDDQKTVSDLLSDKTKSYPSLRFRWGNKTISASFASVQDNTGRRIGTVAVFRDFTREAEVEQMKSAFVSRVSHELRTPLNAILGYAEMLKEGVYDVLSHKQDDAIDRITVNSQQLLGIVNDLLDQAQIEAGTIKISVAPFTPSNLISDVMSMMEVLARAKGLELVSHVADNMPTTIAGDRQRLHQVLVNLVGNAIKFTDQGSVQVHAYQPDPTHWALEVSDTGCGIPSEAHSYVFDPFRQVDNLTTRKHTGAGLGLSIVKQLTYLMGGEVRLKSAVGQGSTFTAVLPLIPSMATETTVSKQGELP